MTIEEALKADKITEVELQVLASNVHLLTDKQKVEFGFAPVVDTKKKK